MQANVEGRARRGTRILVAGLLGTVLIFLGSCESESKPPTGSCQTSNGTFPGVTQAWCTQQGGTWTEGNAALVSPPDETRLASAALEPQYP